MAAEQEPARPSFEIIRWEKVSAAVRKHLCLYDRSVKSYKDKNVKYNAWKRVAVEAKLESAEQAETIWKSMKNKFIRQRRSIHRASKAGCGAVEVQKASMYSNSDIYKLLLWLTAFVQTRRSRYNIHTSSNISQDVPSIDFSDNPKDEEDIKPSIDNIHTSSHVPQNVPQIAPSIDNFYSLKDEEDKNVSNQDDVDDEEVSSDYAGDRGDIDTDDDIPITTTLNSISKHPPRISPATGQDKWGKKKQKLIQEQEFKLLKDIGKSLQNDNGKKGRDEEENVRSMSEDDIYGVLLAKKLSKMNDQQKIHAKHQIDNIVYQIQMQETMCQGCQKRKQPLYSQGQPRSMAHGCHANHNQYYNSRYQTTFSGSASSKLGLSTPGGQYFNRNSPVSTSNCHSEEHSSISIRDGHMDSTDDEAY